MVPYVVHVPSGPVLPAEVDEGVIGLLDVHLTFTLVRGHRAALHGHLPGPELHQVLAGGAAGAGHHAGEQSSGGHGAEVSDEEEEEEEEDEGGLGLTLKHIQALTGTQEHDSCYNPLLLHIITLSSCSIKPTHIHLVCTFTVTMLPACSLNLCSYCVFTFSGEKRVRNWHE